MNSSEKNNSKYKQIKWIILIVAVGVVAILFSLNKHRDAAEADRFEPVEVSGNKAQTNSGAKRTSSSDVPSSGEMNIGAAEVERFQKALVCVRARRALESIKRQLDSCDQNMPETRAAEDDAYSLSCEKRAQEFKPIVATASAQVQSCGTEGAVAQEEQFFKATEAAAAKGDAQAQVCYIASRFRIGRSWTKEEVENYATVAPQYVEEAFRRGDWRAVEILRSATPEVVRQNSLMENLIKDGSDVRFRMNRLLRLGANNQKYANALDANAYDPEKPIAKAKDDEAEAWALRTYNQYFANAPKLTAAPISCPDGDDI